MKLLKYAVLVMTACGVPTTVYVKDDDKLEDLQNQIYALQEQTGSLNALIESDYADCPASGDTSDALIRKICQVAQAATVEARIELTSQLQSYVGLLNQRVDAISDDLAILRDQVDAQGGEIDGLQLDLALVQADIVNVMSDISTLQGQMSSANSAITALQILTNSITGTLNGTMVALDIGSENPAAGPMYETILKRVDSKRLNGYVEAFGVPLTLGNNPLTASNGSAVVTVAATAHGLSMNDRVNLEGLTGARGLSSGHVTGEFTVLSALANSFTINVVKTATSSGTLGGNNGVIKKVVGRGMSTLWKSDDASDVAVRVSNLGNKRYNFLIRRKASDLTNDTAELCYDKTNNLATFVTINAATEGGSGNITCK